MSTAEEKLNDAAKYGDVEEVLSLLSDNPNLNVNWGDEYGVNSLNSTILGPLHQRLFLTVITSNQEITKTIPRQDPFEHFFLVNFHDCNQIMIF